MIEFLNRCFCYCLCSAAVVAIALMSVGCNSEGDPSSPASGRLTDKLSTCRPQPSSDVEKSQQTANWDTIGNRPLYADGEILIVLNDDANPSDVSLINTGTLQFRETIPCRWGTIYRMKIADGSSVEETVKLFASDPDVRIAQPNYLYYFCEAPYVPDDPMWAYQSDPADPKDSIYDQWGPSMVGAPVVWNDTNGSAGMIIAVLDTGVRHDHEDLHDNLWTNTDEIPDNGVDDDANGYIDDDWGWNFADENNNPDDTSLIDYHGTAVAGVAASVQDNFKGVSGIAPGTKIMALKVSFDSTAALESSVAEALNYAVENGATIASMSFLAYVHSTIMYEACTNAWNDGNGINLVAAIGNDNGVYYASPNGFECVISTGGTCPWTKSGQPRDEKRIKKNEDGYPWGSNYGGNLSVMAFAAQYSTPDGEHTDSYWDGFNHILFWGTSCTAPFASGILALIRSYHPTESPAWARTRLEETCDDLNVPGYDVQTGNGRVNAIRAVYGADRYVEFTDPDGFVQIPTPDAQVFETINDRPGSPYHDVEDLYKVTMTHTGSLILSLDIFTWGENLDLAVYSDPGMSELMGESAVENHCGSSFEKLLLHVSAGEDYYIRIFSPGIGNSTAYGLAVHNGTDSLSVTGESISPAVINEQTEDAPILKIMLEIGSQATLDEIILNLHGSHSYQNWTYGRLYKDQDGEGSLDDGDILLDGKIPQVGNRIRFESLGTAWDYTKPLILFFTADLTPTAEESTLHFSLESYKDVSTEESISAEYIQFPIRSNDILVGPG